MVARPMDELQQIAWARADMTARGHHSLRVIMGRQMFGRLRQRFPADFDHPRSTLLGMPYALHDDMEGFAVVRDLPDRPV